MININTDILKAASKNELVNYIIHQNDILNDLNNLLVVKQDYYDKEKELEKIEDKAKYHFERLDGDLNNMRKYEDWLCDEYGIHAIPTAPLEDGDEEDA